MRSADVIFFVLVALLHHQMRNSIVGILSMIALSNEIDSIDLQLGCITAKGNMTGLVARGDMHIT